MYIRTAHARAGLNRGALLPASSCDRCPVGSKGFPYASAPCLGLIQRPIRILELPLRVADGSARKGVPTSAFSRCAKFFMSRVGRLGNRGEGRQAPHCRGKGRAHTCRPRSIARMKARAEAYVLAGGGEADLNASKKEQADHCACCVKRLLSALMTQPTEL